MTQELELWSLIVNATLLVQLVLVVLLAVSVTSWVMIFERFFALRRVASEIEQFESVFWSAGDLRGLFNELVERENGGATLSGMESIFVAGFREFGRTGGAGSDPDATMQAIQRSMRVGLAREEERLSRHQTFLANTASTSPYVGLFGTVWGIMNTFRGLAVAQQVTLQTVAPGISEALIATAMALFAAIPANVAYNRFATQVDSLLGRYEVFTDEFAAILHRTVHGSAGQGRRSAN